MKLSIIIPVYNGETYLRACLDSAVHQTVTDHEVLLVDDGSTDASPSICDEYAERFPFVRVFHTENRGVSAARNTGLDHAQGDYICFLDCDDVVSPCLLEYARALSGRHDVLLFGYTSRSPSDLCGLCEAVETDVVSRREALERNLYNRDERPLYNTGNIAAKLYRRALVQHTRFHENILIGEDKLFNFAALSGAGSIGYAGKLLYYYRVHGDSTVHRYCENYIQNADRHFVEYEKLIDASDHPDLYRKYLSLRAVKVMRNAVALDLCHRDNPRTYRERRELWRGQIRESLTWRYFSRCDQSMLTKRDRFYAHAFRQSFFRIDRMTASRAWKAAEYAVFRVFHR